MQNSTTVASLMVLLSYTGVSGCALLAIAQILTTEITLSVHKLTLSDHIQGDHYQLQIARLTDYLEK